jgi:GxxExxY protein
MPILAEELDAEMNRISESVIGACIEVHRVLGPGLNELIYEAALCHEFDLRGIRYQRQVQIPVTCKDVTIGKGIIDLIVEEKVILELNNHRLKAGGFEAQLKVDSCG